MTDLHSKLSFTKAELAWLMKHDVAAYNEATRLLDYEHYRDERERCENSLVEFLIAAWEHIGESGEPNINWHHEAIAEQLEDLAAGRLETPHGPTRSFIINQPPRTTKTSLVSIALNAWLWCQPKARWGPLMGPHVKFLCVSYGATLAEEIAVKARRLILSEWYQRLWGHQVKIREDQGSRANFANTAGGERLSNSIEGGILGRGGDIQIIDDPHHLKGAESDQQRRETLEGMRSLVTRVTDPRRAARIMVMQRLHQDDATRYALDHWDNPKLIVFPMRFDLLRGRMVPEDDRNYDPDTGQLTEDREGELLWPQVWTPRAVAQEERELGEYGAAGQLAQEPVPRGGGIIKRAWWRLWPDDAESEGEFKAQYRCLVCGWETQEPPMGPAIECTNCGREAERRITYPDTSFRILSVDTAYSEEDQAKNSWNAATRWGIWHDKEEAPRAMLMESWRGRPPLRTGKMQPGQRGLVEQIDFMATQGQVDVVLIEKKTRGVDLYHELEELLSDRAYRLEFFEPTGRGDKVARLTSVSGFFSSDMVWAPDKRWAETVIDEVEAQPRAQFADLTDTCFGAGTLIATRRGDVPIEQVHVGDEVVTPLGFRRVTAAACTGLKPVIERFGLIVTPNHPTFSFDKGWVRIDTITNALMLSRLTLCGLIRLTLQGRFSSSTSHTIAHRTENIIQTPDGGVALDWLNAKGFIGRSGPTRTVARCHRIMMSITKTVIRLTTILRTWRHYRSAIIAHSRSGGTRQKTLRSWQKHENLPLSGTDPKKDGLGIAKMPKPLCLKLTPRNGLKMLWVHKPQEHASGAELHLWGRIRARDFVVRAVGTNLYGIVVVGAQQDRGNHSFASGVDAALCRQMASGLQNTARPHAAVSAIDTSTANPDTKLSSIQMPVWNLSVDEAECYYANGILVHNCSAALIWVREAGLLRLKYEHDKDKRRSLMFRSFARSSVAQQYEEA